MMGHLPDERIYASQSYSGAAKLAAQAACILGTVTFNQTNRQRIARVWLFVMTTVLHGQPLIPYSTGTSSAASLRQLRAPRHFIRPRLLSCIKSKATSTTEKQQQTSEKAQQPPTASQDTTHVQIKTGEPTDPAHVANGSGAKGADMEVDSVLAKELSENGTLYRRCSYYGDKSRVCRCLSIHNVCTMSNVCTAAGFRSTRRTKIICTIGPKSSSTEMLATLAAGGMNVARLNMSHGDHEWHKTVINRIRKLNKDNG